MSAANRIPGKGRLTPALTARFTIDGRTLTAYEGDTVASAMIANGMHLAGRSFKYHRPRGILTAGPEEPNALLDVSRDAARRQPNVRATVQEVFDGMKIETQNRWPSLSLDIGEVNNLLSPFFAAGFYYKTFMWPAKFWEKVYEPLIRRAAGLGKSAELPDPDHYDKAWAHCDVLVIGGGAAGLSAALAAGRAGAGARPHHPVPRNRLGLCAAPDGRRGLELAFVAQRRSQGGGGWGPRGPPHPGGVRHPG